MRRLLHPPRLAIRLGLDAAMVLLFVTSLSFRITGREAHEWTGVSFCLLLIVHVFWNWGWFKNLFAGKYTARRMVNTAANLALVVVIATLCVCGVLNSRHIFGFSQYIDGESVRRMHSFTAYWGLVILGVHTGLHWDMVMSILRKPFASTGKAAARVLRVLAIFTAVLGLWASYERDMASKLFLGFSFDFWPPDRPLALFYAYNLAIMGACACIGHYAQKGLQKFSPHHGGGVMRLGPEAE